MIFLLNHFEKQFNKRATKMALFYQLRELEQELRAVPVAAIEDWLQDDTQTEADIAQLLDFMDGKIELHELISQTPQQPQAECCVCMEKLGIDNFPREAITQQCNHAPTVCRNCLTQSIDSQIPEKERDQIQCPECRETLPYDVVKEWTSPESFERYGCHFLRHQ